MLVDLPRIRYRYLLDGDHDFKTFFASHGDGQITLNAHKNWSDM